MSRIRPKRSPVQQKTHARPPNAAAHKLLSDGALLNLAIGLGLILSIFAVYSQVGHFDFINYDDGDYTYHNPHVQEGLTAGTIKWAMTAVVSFNWMPVTLLSHLLDVQLFGMESGMMHLVNVWIHAFSAVLLFMLFHRATGARFLSAFVAFMFALHPLHVGSVAWIAERKDVLCAFFWFVGLYCYVRYTERPSARRYLLVVGCCCLGLMSKPMMVTFPFTLLLFDIWPLRRAFSPKVVWEKIPLLVLSAVSSVVTYLVQRSAGAVQTEEAYPILMRVGNALISYVIYVWQTFWPARLAVFYPYPKSIAVWQTAVAAICILGVSAVAVRAWRTRPYLTMGWFWYLGTLVPVIGLVQVGAQSHADRYTYIPMIGLCVMLAWGASDALREWPRTKPAFAAAAVSACLVWLAFARNETAYWQNSETLFRRALEVTENNWVAHDDLGNYLMNAPGRAAEAIPHFKALLGLPATALEANNNIGACLLMVRRYAEAIPYLEATLRIKPDLPKVHFNLGMALAQTSGRETNAIDEYEAGLRLEPDNAAAHSDLGLLLLKSGRNQEAVKQLEDAVRLHPDYGSERNLGATLASIPGRESDAITHLEAAQRLKPDPETAGEINRLRKEVNGGGRPVRDR